ncbi:MAG: hypothetical protein ACJA06_000696 [Halocynthiibacter sp.]|jgi:hypothetical protein
MTLQEAIAQGPAWIGYWLNWMMLGAFILPIALLIWRQSRLAGFLTLITGVLGGIAVDKMYDQMGYVKLLGLPHIILWTPLAIYLIAQLRRADMPVWPKRIIAVALTTILISLAFDYTDAVRYFLGETTPLAMPAPAS